MSPLTIAVLAAAAAPVTAPALVQQRAPPPSAKVERVLVLETRADAAWLPKVKAFGDLLATILEQRTTAEIVPSSSVKDRLTVAADRLSAGCDDTACMSEIAGALDARWVVALMNEGKVNGKQLLSPTLINQMVQHRVPVPGESDSYYGYGLTVFKYKGLEYVGHGGFSRGYGDSAARSNRNE